ncbi:cytochrome P450 [Xylariaceae sp. FL1019]|nr:cytochrome P450 [Xylariaceae sp. FL1019]
MTRSYHCRTAGLLGCIGFLCAYHFFHRFNQTRTRSWAATQCMILLLELVIIRLWYQLSLHPLAKYPGPLLAACTDWYTVYWIASGDRHLELHRQHKRHGKYVRYGPSRLSINSAVGSKDLHRANANTFKSSVYGSFKHFFGAEMSLTTVDHKIHAFRRRVNAIALNHSAIAGFEARVKPHVDFLINTITQSCLSEESSWSSPQNMAHVLAYCVADIMGDMTFSQHWNVQRHKKNRHFVHDLPKGVAGIHLVGHMQWLLRFNLHTIVFKHLIQGVTKLMALSRQFADTRAKKTNYDDIWASLLESKDLETGKCFSHEELVSEASLFIIGGTDGMITALTSTLFYLTHNSKALVELTREIRKTYSEPPFVDPHERDRVDCPIRFGSRELQNITYLSACIDEAMRLSPPVPSILPRVVGPGGIVVDGQYFPEGIDLGIPHYTLHRSPEHFPQPLEYKPERWLQRQEGAKLVAGTGQAVSFTPFGAGRSSCVGKHVAYYEMTYVLARLLWQFDLRLDPSNCDVGGGTGTECEGRGCKQEFQLSCRFVSQQDGPVLQFRLRNNTAVGGP